MFELARHFGARSSTDLRLNLSHIEQVHPPVHIIYLTFCKKLLRNRYRGIDTESHLTGNNNPRESLENDLGSILHYLANHSTDVSTVGKILGIFGGVSSGDRPHW